MNWSTFANIAGFVFLIGAGVTISKVESAELGEHSSRFMATVLALSVYYGATSIGGFGLDLGTVKFGFLQYLVPALGVIGIAYYGVKIYQNWSTETKSVMKSSIKLLGVAAFAFIARFLLSQ